MDEKGKSNRPLVKTYSTHLLVVEERVDVDTPEAAQTDQDLNEPKDGHRDETDLVVVLIQQDDNA